MANEKFVSKQTHTPLGKHLEVESSIKSMINDLKLG